MWGVSNQSPVARSEATIQGFFVGSAFKGQESIDEVIHKVDHHFALRPQENRSQVVHGNAPSRWIYEKKGECRACLSQDGVDIVFKAPSKCRRLNTAAMLFKSLLKSRKSCRRSFHEDRANREIPLSLGEPFADRVQLIQSDTNRSVAQFFVHCTPGSGETVYIHELAVRKADMVCDGFQILLKKKVLEIGLFTVFVVLESTEFPPISQPSIPPSTW